MSTTVDTSTYASRLTGLFSDLDTDAIVKSLCSTQQAKIDKQSQKKTTYEWYEEALNNVVDKVKEFQNTYCSALGTSSMLKSDTYYQYSVESDSSSKAVSLSTNSSALEGSYTVKVIQLAKNASKASSGKVSADGTEISASNTATLAQLSLKNSLQFDYSGNISFAINGKEFTFSKDTTLQSMINTINTDSDANVTMKYSRLTDTFTITADSGGDDSSVAITNLSGNAFGENSAFMISEGAVRNGCNSIAEINGVTVTKDSNEYSIDGVTFTLNAVTEDTDEETLTFSVKRDYSATVDAISSFVDAFNALISSLTELTGAKDYSGDYPPLTEAQEEEMTEKQIEAWNEKAKNGVLSNNPELNSLVSSLKNAFFSAAGGTGKSATSVGISGGSYYSTDSGRIFIDKDKLTAALEKNPEEVISMFTNGSVSASSSDQGVIYKMRSTVTSYLDSVKTTIDTTGEKIDDIEDDIDGLTVKLDKLAERYYQKFSQMETALSTLNAQSSYISQLFSS